MPRPDAAQKLAATAPRRGPSRGVIGVIVAAVAIVAVVAAVLIGQALGRGDATGAPAASGGSSAAAGATPKGATGFGGAMVLNPSAPAGAPVLDIFEDPQCPICKEFEAIFGPAISQLIAANEAKVVVHTMSFLDGNLRNDSSVRAANAAMCAADQGEFHDYMSAVFAGQPAREGDGWTDTQLEAFAVTAGVKDLSAWKSCVAAKTYVAHVKALEVNSEKSGVTGTPTVRLNGQNLPLGGLDAAAFRAKVKAATK